MDFRSLQACNTVDVARLAQLQDLAHVLGASSVSQGDWPKKPVVSSYDVVEKGGFVWLFYGSRSVPEDVRPPIPMMPEVRRCPYRAVVQSHSQP
jgi:phenylpropionate dioxygenase-like ring-hydroxylating dioxygenase large terminal subunit